MTDQEVFRLCNGCPHLGYKYKHRVGSVWMCDKYDKFQKMATKACVRDRMEEFKQKEIAACTTSKASSESPASAATA